MPKYYFQPKNIFSKLSNFKWIVLLSFSLFGFKNVSQAQVVCNNPLGTISPSLGWQYFYHTCRGYVSFQAQAGCTYQFTYCSSIAPSAYYNGDPYLCITNQPTSGQQAANDDWCGLGSYVSWTAPATGTYYMNVGNCCSSGCGCGFSRNMGYRSTNCAGGVTPPSSITASSNTICSGQSVTLTANGAMGTQFWYTGVCGGNQIGTGATLTVSPAVTTTYYVNNNSGGQFSPSCASITITVQQAPAGPTVSGNLVLCGPGSTVLTASGGQNYVWYSDPAGANQVGTGSTFTTPVISTTTTYYVNSQQGGNLGVGTATLNYTAGPQTFTAPATGTYTFQLWGAQGGNGLNTVGGLGGYATGTLALTAGQVINVYVGGKGGNAGGVMGWNGGGQGGIDSGAGQHGGSGGGASDIRVGGAGLANRVIVAGGGAGGGRDAATGVGGGSSGTTSGGYNSGQPGTGGTQVGGGLAWTLARGATHGTLGIGGAGSTGYNAAGGGGGGGGYYGGGGGTSTQNHGQGWSCGGGGGSSYIGGVGAGTTTQGVQSNNGLCTITWNIQGCSSALTPVTVTVNPQPIITTAGATICAGQTATLTATSNIPGGTFIWSPGNLNGASISVTPNTTTTYSVSYTSVGCAPVTANATVTVNAVPPAPLASGVSLCGPGSANLTASGGQNNNYIWYSNANGTGQLAATANYTTPNLQNTTTYYVQTASAQGGSQLFNFTGGVQTFTAPIAGVYTLSAWGAKGGDDGMIGANGGYANGTIALNAGQTMTVYVGGLGQTCVAGGGGGYNGGGNAGPAGCSGGGGGASDIRMGGVALGNRILVAGGGGGAGCCGAAAGAGGGINGLNGSGSGGTQAAGGAGNAAGSLGLGGNKNGDGGGGGGGYYGGGAAVNDDGGGGGSSYTGGVLGGSTIAGNAAMPNPNGGMMNGNAGNGYVLITWSGLSCASALTPVTVTINPVPVITVNNDTVCAGQTATLNATATVPGGTFTWTPGNLSGPTINVSPNTTTVYTVSYSVQGCPPVTANATVTVNPLQPITGTLTACLGLTSQLANVVTPGSWSSSNVGVAPISNNGLVSAVSPGTSTITYNAGNGCSTTSQFTVFPQPLLTATPSNVLCFGGSGSVSLSAAGANAPYTYGGAATQNLQPGTYTYTATSVDGCISTPVSVTITQPAAGLALTTTQVNVLCSGNNTGSINLTVTGGTAPYTYAWSNNTTLEDPAGLAAGTYTVTVTDANGCTATTTVTITQPATLSSSYTQVNVGCFGNNTGSIDLTVSGGVAPYVYAWSNQAITQDLNTIPSGVYTVTATDANGCTTTQTVTITQPQGALALSTTQVNVLCFGNSTGSVNLTVSGGTAPYTYLWSNNGTVEDPTGMAAGSYTVTVTDANGCTANSNVTITQPAVGLALTTTQVNVLCNGNNTGSVNLTVTGGTAPYTYLWSNNGTAEDPTGMAAGAYTVTVTDASGCTANTTVTITQPATLSSSYTQVNVGCFGNNTGSIDLTVSGGVAPYVYAWSNQAITQDLNTIPSGVYTVTATDANGCTTTQTVTITQPQGALALSTTQVNVLCFGNSTGSVNLTVSGGTAPYTYLWSNNGTVEDPSGMAAGPYTVTVTDANGCTANSNVTITQPAAGLALTTTQVNVLCNGNNTGSVNLTVTGGTAPYTYLWSNNGTAEDPTGMAAGAYTVTVTDANGCTANTFVTITQPAAPLAVTVTAQNILCLNGTGSVNSIPTGGVAPYSYSWTNQGITQNITNLQAGSYTVTVQDANGCTANAMGTVVITLSPVPVQILNLTGTTVLTCTTPAITLQATGGVTYAWTGGATPANDTNVVNNPGTYTVNMVDPNGCPVSQTITLTQNITLPTPGITNVTGATIIDCNAPNIDLLATGGGTYQWNNNLGTSANVNITQAGTYNVVVTAANGCVDSANVVITVAPVPAVTNIDTTICSGQSVVLTPVYYPAGGQSIWTNGQTTANITVNPNATTVYSVLYTWNGCVATGDMTVTVIPTPTLTAGNANICFGDTALLTATPSLPNGTFNWLTTNQNTQNISVNPQITSSYNVTYTLNGCTSPQATSTVTVTPLPIITVQDITICEGQTGVLSANVNVPGGDYSWSQGDTTSSISESPITTTTYIVDYVVNGCVGNPETATINVNPLPIASFEADTTTGCVPVTINFSADTTGQQATYSWTSNGAGSQVGANAQMTFSNGGCYDVTLTATMNGCPNTTTLVNYVCVQNYPEASFSPNPPAFTEASQTINFTNNTLGATGYVWNFGDGSLSNEEYPSHLFQGTNDGFTITLIASTSMGCMDSVSVEMTADIGAVYYIPNTFTPDGDKYNQTFKPVLSTGVSSEGYEMLIFNRWGEIMFESHNLNVGWDGSYGVDGLDCMSGTYTYKITFKLTTAEDKRIITGHVNLIR